MRRLLYETCSGIRRAGLRIRHIVEIRFARADGLFRFAYFASAAFWLFSFGRFSDAGLIFSSSITAAMIKLVQMADDFADLRGFAAGFIVITRR